MKYFWNYQRRFLIHTADDKCIEYFRSHTEEFIELTEIDFTRLLVALSDRSLD